MPTQIATINSAKLEPYLDPNANMARTLALQPAPNLSVAAGTLLGQVTATGQVTPYAAANADGSQVNLIGPSEYAFTTDANGLATYGGAGSVTDLVRSSHVTVPVYYKGNFLESDLVGLDANAVAVLKAREIGIGAAKFLHIP